MSNTIYSIHTLMFPFIFDSNVIDVNRTLVREGLWIHKPFNPAQSHHHYNEYIYFYEYTRRALYQTGAYDERKTSYYFEYRDQNGTYILDTGDKTFELNITGITMRTFDTGIAIFSIELENSRYADEESILQINDFARRTYPQFLGEKGLEDVKGVLLPHKVTIGFSDETIEEDFSYYASMDNIANDATALPAFIHELLGKERFSSYPESEKIHIEPIIDDRMFVLSLYMNDEKMDQLKRYDETTGTYAYEEDDFWYKYLFVDGKDKTCQSRHMTKNLLKTATYDRWVEWGTLFGISRYSFVALTGSWFGRERLLPHMKTIYFQMFTLLLAYRATILNFSKRVAKLKLDGNSAFDLRKLQHNVAELYRDYINFQNNLFFREITAQEQGIELYTCALKTMQIEKQIKDLDQEIEELHTYVSIKNEESRNDRLEMISKLGAVFLPPALISGILGINSASFMNDLQAMYLSMIAIMLSVLFGWWCISSKRWLQKIGIVLLILLFLITPLYLSKKHENASKSPSAAQKHVAPVTHINKEEKSE